MLYLGQRGERGQPLVSHPCGTGKPDTHEVRQTVEGGKTSAVDRRVVQIKRHQTFEGRSPASCESVTSGPRRVTVATWASRSRSINRSNQVRATPWPGSMPYTRRVTAPPERTIWSAMRCSSRSPDLSAHKRDANGHKRGNDQHAAQRQAKDRSARTQIHDGIITHAARRLPPRPGRQAATKVRSR